jgi:hypothetical protein
MRGLIAAAVSLVALALIGVIAFFVVLVLAGPHSDLLPDALAPLVIGLGWLALLLLPAWFARRIWRALGRPAREGATRDR